MRKLLFTIGICLITNLITAQTWVPRDNWKDSFENGGFCWCDNNTNYDHGLNTKSLTINGSDYNIVTVCEELRKHPAYRDYIEGDLIYNDIQCGNGPANDAADEEGCPGRVDMGSAGCNIIGPTFDMAWLSSREIFGGSDDSSSCSSTFNAFSQIQAQDFCDEDGIQVNSNGSVGHTHDQDWIKFENVNFGSGADTFKASVATGTAGGSIQIRLNSTSGTLLGSLPVSNNGGWSSYAEEETTITTVSGTQDIYLVFTGGGGALLDIVWFQFSEASNTGSGNIVHITKRNATNFAIDGNDGGGNGQDVRLLYADENDINQQWIEIDEGNGYYSYQKNGTNYCIDGNHGGAIDQNVYLWSCIDGNQNQHWLKEAVGDGSFRLIKRNASGFAIDGGSGGVNERSIELYTAVNHQNLQWYINSIGSTTARTAKDLEVSEILFYPNPIKSSTTIMGAANTTLELYNLSGQLLLEKRISTDTQELDLSFLKTGIYYAKLKGLSTNFTSTIIKN